MSTAFELRAAGDFADELGNLQFPTEGLYTAAPITDFRLDTAVAANTRPSHDVYAIILIARCYGFGRARESDWTHGRRASEGGFRSEQKQWKSDFP